MRKFIALVALAVTAACGGSESPSEPLVATLAGTYTLRLMNDAPLPYTLPQSDRVLVIDTDVLTLAEGGQWGETVTYRQTIGTGTTTNESANFVGTWTRAGNALSFRSEGQPFYVGSAAVDTLRLTDGPFNYVFTR